LANTRHASSRWGLWRCPASSHSPARDETESRTTAYESSAHIVETTVQSRRGPSVLLQVGQAGRQGAPTDYRSLAVARHPPQRVLRAFPLCAGIEGTCDNKSA